MSDLLQDLRFGLRLLARNRGFAVVAILTLAIALGANTAVFSLMDGVLLRALPYPEPDRILDVAILHPPREGRPERRDFLDGESFQALREQARTVEQLAAYQPGLFTLVGQGPAERLAGASVSAALFPLLRVPPALGRELRNEEERPGEGRVVLLSDRLWHRRFAGDPALVGKSISLGGASGFKREQHPSESWALSRTPSSSARARCRKRRSSLPITTLSAPPGRAPGD